MMPLVYSAAALLVLLVLFLTSKPKRNQIGPVGSGTDSELVQ